MCFSDVKDQWSDIEKLQIFVYSQGLGVSFITLDEYPLNLVPFDNDLLSLEMDGAFKVQFYFNMIG